MVDCDFVAGNWVCRRASISWISSTWLVTPQDTCSKRPEANRITIVIISRVIFLIFNWLAPPESALTRASRHVVIAVRMSVSTSAVGCSRAAAATTRLASLGA